MLDKLQAQVYQYFDKTHWLGDADHIEHLMLWNTFYRRNLHRFVEDYLGIKLHIYQKIVMYLMGKSTLFVWIAARAASKSFIIAIYAVSRAILYPGSEIVITSGTRGQSVLILREKIVNLLMLRSPNLCREIKAYNTNIDKAYIEFYNRSSIRTVTCSPNARGNRSTVNIGEEAREIDKSIWDTVITPFKIVRDRQFIFNQFYENNPDLIEEPLTILISSSIEDTHWLYKEAVAAAKGMVKGNGANFVAFDYSVTLRHNIKTRNELQQARLTTDDLTWAIEYENLVVRSNSKAYFSYELVNKCQSLRMPFYPRRNEDVINHKPNVYAIDKQEGEIRVVSCDIAMVNRTANDNSVFSCLRLFPETIKLGAVVQTEYRVQVPYLEAIRGTETKKQAIRIRQLFEDFDADYIVLDLRNSGRNALFIGNNNYYMAEENGNAEMQIRVEGF